jgi:hypothetical protein
MIRIMEDIHTVIVLNNVVAKLCKVALAPSLHPVFFGALSVFIEKDPKTWFADPASRLCSVFDWILQNIDSSTCAMLLRLFELEYKDFKTTNRSTALFSRALWKYPPTGATVQMFANTPFGRLVTSLHTINQQLDSEDLRDKNIDIYSDLLLNKADLLARSPDARVSILLELSRYFSGTKYLAECLAAQLTVATLIAECLDRLDRIPDFFGRRGEIAKHFALVCPCAISEECPADVAADLPRLRGFCTSAYFSQYGLIWSLTTPLSTCLRAQMFEVQTKILWLLNPIAQYHNLWKLMRRQYTTGQVAWKAIHSFSGQTDRLLGMYFFVQLPGDRSYVYRVAGLTNLWEVSQKLAKSLEFYSKGLPINITNEGEELVQGDKFNVLVKKVDQYFTVEEQKKRVTVFENNYNVSRFFFEVPMTKDSQKSAILCWTRRTIITLPHPFPYIVNRIQVPKGNLEKTVFSPIELACQKLQEQADLTEEFVNKKNIGQLERVLYGSLVTMVNEGPRAYAEAFLGPTAPMDPHQSVLRAIYRKLLVMFAQGVDLLRTNQQTTLEMLHALEQNLNSLTSYIQLTLS